MILAKNITKSYDKLQVLKGVDIEVAKGEIVTIVGASGAGKSTLLHILGSLDKPDSGSVEINGENHLNLTGRKLATFRNKHIGFVFQFHNLLPEFNAVENIAMPAYIAGKKKNEANNAALELLDFLGLVDRANHKPGELSGGEQQRVAVARALINRPSVVMADEPSGNLDSENSHMLYEVFRDLSNKLDQTFLIVTHDKELAAKTDKQLVMSDGLFVS